MKNQLVNNKSITSRELKLSQTDNQYDQLFEQITSHESRQAADKLFEMSANELNKKFKGDGD